MMCAHDFNCVKISGTKIRDHRKRLGMTRAEFAKFYGIKVETLKLFEGTWYERLGQWLQSIITRRSGQVA